MEDNRKEGISKRARYYMYCVRMYVDDTLIKELIKHLPPSLLITSDEIRMLDISLGQGT